MNGPTELERRLEATWLQSAKTAIESGIPPSAVAKSMLAAALRLMLNGYGPAATAQQLGLLAISCHEQAGGTIDELLPGEEARDARTERH